MIDTLNLSFQKSKHISRLYSKLEPLKNQKPTHKNITVPQSACIIQILDELIRKLEIIDYFELITTNDTKIKHLIHLDLTDQDPNLFDTPVENIEHTFLFMCQNHRSLVKNELKVDKATLNMLIQSSTKDINRVLLRRSKLFERIKVEFRDLKNGNSEFNELIGLLKELREFIHERLITTPTEETEMITHSEKMVVKDQQHQKKIEILRKEKTNLIQFYTDQIQSKNALIRKLENDVKETENTQREKMQQFQKTAELMKQNEHNDSLMRKAKYQKQLDDIKDLLKSYVTEHRDQELKLRQDRWKHEEHNIGLLRKYDNGFTIKQNKYDEFKRAYDEELAVLHELEEKIKPLEAEYNKIMEEFNIKEAIRKQEQDYFDKWTKVAFTVQAFWTGYRLRKGINKRVKKKNKNKGKTKQK